MRRYNQISGQNIQRIEFLSDGVFAIAITLLVLDIRVPIRDNISSEKDLIIAFFKLTPKLLTYFLSFMTLGIFWTAHSTQFHFIEKSDRNFNWLNLSFLLFVTTTPFTTAFLSDRILGTSGLSKGWKEVTIKPGAFVKLGLRFDFDSYNESIKALEIGLSVDAYAREIKQMVYSKPGRVFFQGHIGFVFGGRK